MSEATEITPEKAPEFKPDPPTKAEAPVEEPAKAESTAPAATETNGKPSGLAAEAKKPYDQLLADLGSILKEADYNEVYGLKLSTSGDFQTSIILQVLLNCLDFISTLTESQQKFLRANANDLPKAKEQLLSTLKWRKEFQPLKARDEVFSKKRFNNLGYVVELKDLQDSSAECPVVTFNIYGGVKDNKVTFEDIPGYVTFRLNTL